MTNLYYSRFNADMLQDCNVFGNLYNTVKSELISLRIHRYLG